MTMRTLTIGDRTISYDTGLNYISSPNKEMVGSRVLDSDEGTNTCTSSEADYSGTASVCSEDHEDGDQLGGERLMREGSRKLIKPDLMAMSQLLNFDEEEEDDLESEEEDDENEKPETPKDWHKAVVKDLTQLSKEKVERRHSITLCESSPRRKKSSVSSITSSSSSSRSSASSTASSTRSSPKNSFSFQNGSFRGCEDSPTYQLNTSQMHATLHDEYNSAEWQRALQTLNLSLEEVAHIRSVLTKAELEGMPLDGDIKENVWRGKVCFLCMKTKFGMFSRGQRCDMCKQCVCTRCYTKMRIPVDHFSAMPVYALSPTCVEQTQSPRERLPFLKGTSNGPLSKIGIPDLPGMTNSAGSAPNSPGSERRGQSQPHSLESQYCGGISTISGTMESLPPVSSPPAEFQPVSLPPVTDKFATLPKKTNRRWSMISSRSQEREKLEGSLLTVCIDCKEMVLQVIRTSRTTKKMQLARSVFFSNFSPNSYGQHRL